MRNSALAASSVLLLSVAALVANQQASSPTPYTTATLSAADSGYQNGTERAVQSESSPDETKAYVWLAKFAVSKLK